MALRNLRYEGDELLYKKSREITEINDRILQLLDDMAETMYKTEGVGLAAPQVGVLRRCVVIDIGKGLVKLINPEIIERSEEEIESMEGCLSVPDHVGIVRRPAKVTVTAKNELGEDITIEGEGFFAKALCHEIDHLNGILFTDIAETLYTREEYEKMLDEAMDEEEEDTEE